MQRRHPAVVPLAWIRRFERKEAAWPAGNGEMWTEHQVLAGATVLRRFRSADEAEAFVEGWRAAMAFKPGTIPVLSHREVSHPAEWRAGYSAYVRERSEMGLPR